MALARVLAPEIRVIVITPGMVHTGFMPDRTEVAPLSSRIGPPQAIGTWRFFFGWGCGFQDHRHAVMGPRAEFVRRGDDGVQQPCRL